MGFYNDFLRKKFKMDDSASLWKSTRLLKNFCWARTKNAIKTLYNTMTFGGLV